MDRKAGARDVGRREINKLAKCSILWNELLQISFFFLSYKGMVHSAPITAERKFEAYYRTKQRPTNFSVVKTKIPNLF